MSQITSKDIGNTAYLPPEWYLDPYQQNRRWPEPCRCPECGAVYRGGNWHWPRIHEETSERICPACTRIQQSLPAGYLAIHGSFFSHHYMDIEGLVTHLVARSISQHPMKRLMGSTKHSDGSQMMTFTEPHLSFQVAEELRQAYDGLLDVQFQKGDYLIRLMWRKDL